VSADGGDQADDRESLLQALPPAVSREAAAEGGRRLGLKREAPAGPAIAESTAEPAAEAAPETDAAPRKRTRARKPVAEPAAE
jgi:hypothetical protein